MFLLSRAYRQEHRVVFRMVLAVALAICTATASAGAVVVYVDAAAPGPVHNGASWGTAFTTIGAAVNSLSGSGDVWIKTGTYRERVTLKTYVSLYGGFLGYETSVSQRLPEAFPTVIDAGCKGRAIYIPQNARVTLDGLTIRRGVADYGGGIRCDLTCVPHVRNCRIELCKATISGGGVYFGKYALGEMTDCVVTGCSAPNGGGGVIEYHSYPAWRRNVIVRNHATANGGGLYCPFHSGALLENCTLAYNSSDGTGGAVYANYGGPVTLNYCIIANNSAPQGGGIYGGGGSSQTTVTHTVFFSNSGGDWGGAITGFPSYAGNLLADPQFISSAFDEYHLCAASPCGGMGAFPLEAAYKIDRIGVAKKLADGVAVQLWGKVVSGVDGDVTYVQEPDRASAIAVRGLAGYQAGDVLAVVSGTLSTESGARVLVNSTASMQVRGVFRLSPVGVPIAHLASARGLFVRTWGRVESVTSGRLVLRDGDSTVDVRRAFTDIALGRCISVVGTYTLYGSLAADAVAPY